MWTVNPKSLENRVVGRKQRPAVRKKPCLLRHGALIGCIGSETVRVVYSDETGMGAKRDEPITVVAAIMMNMDQHWPAVEAELNAVRADTPKTLLHEERELKGALLYSAVRKKIKKASEILARTLMVVENCRIPVFYGAVDRKGYDKLTERLPATEREKRATSDDVAFDACLARVDTFAHAEMPPNEQILWIADRSNETQERRTKFGLWWAKFLKSENRDLTGLSYVIARTLEPLRIADTIYFGHSHESLALQLADVCCSTIKWQLLESLYGYRPCAGPFYKLIQLRVMNDGTPPLFRENAGK